MYQYDEVYDQMEQKKSESLEAKKSDRKVSKGFEHFLIKNYICRHPLIFPIFPHSQPKYIQKLLLHAEKRKIEHERRLERQIQKEREAEGDEFADKESFVTSAYKKKLEEMQQLDEEEKRLDMLESKYTHSCSG